MARPLAGVSDAERQANADKASDGRLAMAAKERALRGRRPPGRSVAPARGSLCG
jgi:hypothetical protein